MEKQYLIQLTFYDGKDEKSLYWLPSLFCFTFALPLDGIPAGDLNDHLSFARQHALQILGPRALHVYAHAMKEKTDYHFPWYSSGKGD